MANKNQTLFALFILLILVLFVKPSMFRDMYTSVLGRLMLVIVVIYFASNNVLFGLLSVLIIAIGSQMLMHNGILEGMENKINVVTTATTGATNATATTGPSATNATVATDVTPVTPVGDTTTNLVDREEAIRPKQAKAIPVDKKPADTEPASSSTEAFRLFGTSAF
jgi:hypothetical protein